MAHDFFRVPIDCPIYDFCCVLDTTRAYLPAKSDIRTMRYMIYQKNIITIRIFFVRVLLNIFVSTLIYNIYSLRSIYTHT